MRGCCLHSPCCGVLVCPSKASGKGEGAAQIKLFIPVWVERLSRYLGRLGLLAVDRRDGKWVGVSWTELWLVTYRSGRTGRWRGTYEKHLFCIDRRPRLLAIRVSNQTEGLAGREGCTRDAEIRLAVGHRQFSSGKQERGVGSEDRTYPDGPGAARLLEAMVTTDWERDSAGGRGCPSTTPAGGGQRCGGDQCWRPRGAGTMVGLGLGLVEAGRRGANSAQWAVDKGRR